MWPPTSPEMDAAKTSDQKCPTWANTFTFFH
jgi:hypothetical protein